MPSSVSITNQMITVGIGTIGGLIFAYLNLPLPWIVGSMVFCAVVAVATPLKLQISIVMFRVMLMIVGVTLGAAFSPELLLRAKYWTGTLAGMVLCTVLSVWVGMTYLKLVTNYDSKTRFLTAAPGAMTQIIPLCLEMGADVRTISLVHTIRGVSIAALVPPVMHLAFNSHHVPIGLMFDLHQFTNMGIEHSDIILLSGCMLGAPLARFLRIPSADLLGPMVLSGILHALSLTSATTPLAVSAIAQMVIGSMVGCFFVGMTLAELVKTARVSLGLVALLCVISIGFAYALHVITEIALSSIILAYMPGGIPEMSLLAVELGMDPAFVATHHSLRVFMVVAGVTFLGKHIKKQQAGV